MYVKSHVRQSKLTDFDLRDSPLRAKIAVKHQIRARNGARHYIPQYAPAQDDRHHQP